MRSYALPILAVATLAAVVAIRSPDPAATTDLPPSIAAANCSGTSTGLIPITDLGAGFYQGAQGGLYPGGGNGRPAAHDAAGIAIANAIGPLDTLGQPDPGGRIVLVSIGMSNCTQEFSAFVPRCLADPVRRPEVLPIDCAVGGQTASIIKNPTAWYWDTVATRLRGHGSSPNQVQVIWIKEANAGPTGNFTQFSDALVADFGAVARTIHDMFPNARLAYWTSRIYAGYASTPLNPEPYAYQSGFVVKRLIAAQIAGEDSLNYDPVAGAVEAPWLAWGPYLWADGLTPRSDGLTWACSEFSSTDGTHPSATGRAKVADSLLAFFRADATTAPWYRVATTAVPPVAGTAADGLSLTAHPVPARGEVTCTWAATPSDWRLDIVDTSGRRVRELAAGGASGSAGGARWDLRDDSGRRVAPGVYWARLRAGTAQSRAKVVVR